jgi:predicted dehydrogenase
MTNPAPKNTRRDFLKRSAAASAVFAVPTIIPASALGGDGKTAPSNRIVMASVGWGMQGPWNADQHMNYDDCQVVAICDLDKNVREGAARHIDEYNKSTGCKAYHDYREMMARDDLDAVILSVPDTWHALTAIEAAKNKLDIWGEKPLARTIAEQQAIVKAVEGANLIWQTGSWQRSQANFRKGCEMVRNGLIGKVKHVEVGLPGGHNDFAGTRDKRDITDPPESLDYDMWIGPSKMEPYIECRIHKNWRWNYNIGGGQLLDWIGHHCDIAHWGLDYDNNGPIEVEGQGEFPAPDAIWNTCTKYRIESTYASGVTMTIAGGHSDIRSGTKWIGEDGWVWVDRGGFECSNPEWNERLKKEELPDDIRKVQLYVSPGHHRNLLDSIKSRKPTLAPVATAHHSAIPGHLGLIAMMTGRKIKWDPEKEVIIGDGEASKLLTREYRDPWKLS